MHKQQLVIDIGNTNVKAAVFDDVELKVMKTVSLGGLGNLIDEMIVSHMPTRMIASSVSVSKDELELLVANRIPWLFFTPDFDLPINVEYRSVSTLGVDRLAGLLAVHFEHLDNNVLVIDVGTCITYDLLTHDRRYFGGSISPGLEMRYRALHSYTKNLPYLNPVKPVALIGQTTEDSIHSGVVNGILFEIDGAINIYKERFGSLVVVMTGGNLKSFANELKNTIFADPFLVLKGLNHILNYHYQNR